MSWRGGALAPVCERAHDLTGSVRRLGNGVCEYLRATTGRLKEVAD
jgi:hypothetical protein